MDRLTYPGKFAWLSVLFLLPRVTVMYLLVTEINSRIDFARQELDGTRYLRSLRSLQHEVGQSQHLAVQYAQGKTVIRPELIRQQGAIDDSLQRVLTLDQTLAASLGSATKLSVVRETGAFCERRCLARTAASAMSCTDSCCWTSPTCAPLSVTAPT